MRLLVGDSIPGSFVPTMDSESEPWTRSLSNLASSRMEPSPFSEPPCRIYRSSYGSLAVIVLYLDNDPLKT